jgi:hypothetical protein
VLEVMQPNGEPAHAFSCHSGGVRSLCFKLDAMYREWLGQQLMGAETPHPEGTV